MSPYRTVNVSKLTPGDKLVEPVFSEGLTKLLGSGCAVSELVIKRLAERGVTEVVVRIPAEPTGKHQRNASLPVSLWPQNTIDSARLVEHSCQCGSVIAIHAPAADLPIAAWICKTCRAVYFGGVDSIKTHGVELLDSTNSKSHTGDGQSDPIGESTLAKADVTPCGTSVDTFSGRDRRQQTRYSMGLPIVAVPLRADFSIAGPAVRMTTRDISQSGIALAYARFSEVPYYVIDFTSAGFELLQVLLQVLRVSNIGPTYEVAGKFIDRLHCAK